MNVLLDEKTYSPDNIFLYDPIKNAIINGYFIKMVYSTEYFTMNGLYIEIKPTDYTELACVKINEKYISTVKLSQTMSNKLKHIEFDILNKKHGCMNVPPQYKLSNHIDTSTFKLHLVTPIFSSILFKVSGIWKNDCGFGITYKLVPMKPKYNISN